jgi:hypothetical protein
LVPSSDSGNDLVGVFRPDEGFGLALVSAMKLWLAYLPHDLGRPVTVSGEQDDFGAPDAQRG